MHYIKRTNTFDEETSETVCTDGWVPDEIQERVPDCGTDN